MTPKEIAETIIKVDESEGCYLVDIEVTYKVPELAKAYLALESRIQKLEAVAEAARKLYWPECIEKSEKDCAAFDGLLESLAELERK